MYKSIKIVTEKDLEVYELSSVSSRKFILECESIGVDWKKYEGVIDKSNKNKSKPLFFFRKIGKSKREVVETYIKRSLEKYSNNSEK